MVHPQRTPSWVLPYKLRIQLFTVYDNGGLGSGVFFQPSTPLIPVSTMPTPGTYSPPAKPKYTSDTEEVYTGAD